MDSHDLTNHAHRVVACGARETVRHGKTLDSDDYEWNTRDRQAWFDC